MRGRLRVRAVSVCSRVDILFDNFGQQIWIGSVMGVMWHRCVPTRRGLNGYENPVFIL